MYNPSKKELKQIKDLNKGYALIKEGIAIIRDSIVKKDSEIEMLSYKISKSFDKLTKRTCKILEKQYVDKEFLDIVINAEVKEKNNRLKKKDSKKVPKEKKVTKIKKTSKKKKDK